MFAARSRIVPPYYCFGDAAMKTRNSLNGIRFLGKKRPTKYTAPQAVAVTIIRKQKESNQFCSVFLLISCIFMSQEPQSVNAYFRRPNDERTRLGTVPHHPPFTIAPVRTPPPPAFVLPPRQTGVWGAAAQVGVVDRGSPMTTERCTTGADSARRPVTWFMDEAAETASAALTALCEPPADAHRLRDKAR
ncbi:hypothetical protein GWI33_005297 [Rhynchophorus ferrugineus]|uniref:Uncharacterized protein n=1 Tax=Rhynchophorus ferrugineus TaxID=354439 RepID=A0A834MJP5_RHYFE|nr:hypothetical protein GWI33_005297 [Rhynchophorus ferrugineus]